MNFARRIVIAGLAGCALSAALGRAARAQQLEMTSVRLGVANKSHLYYLPLTLAERRGYFRDYGLNVAISDFEGGGQSLDALLEGTVDVVTGAYEHTLRMQAKGQNVRASAVVRAVPPRGLRRAHAHGVRLVRRRGGVFSRVLEPFGALTDAQWRHLTRHSIAWDEKEERFAMLCDPGIVRAFRNPWQYSVDLWKYWKAIRVPILVVRGEDSDLLPSGLADRMERLNPLATVRTFAGCGHAPPLLTAEQTAPVVEFLCAQE